MDLGESFDFVDGVGRYLRMFVHQSFAAHSSGETRAERHDFDGETRKEYTSRWVCARTSLDFLNTGGFYDLHIGGRKAQGHFTEKSQAWRRWREGDVLGVVVLGFRSFDLISKRFKEN